MKKLFGWLFWLAIFVVLLVGIDRYLMETRSDMPMVSEVQEFYRDFRQRLAGIFAGEGDHVAQIIEESAEPIRTPAAKKASPTPAGEPRFLYVDGGGKLHFADSLEEVPPPYREEAQPLEQ